MRTKVLWAVLGLWAGAAQATTMLREEVPELTRSSDAVVRGKVVRTESRWSSDRMRIYTEIELEVSESLKGAPAKRITLVQPGGVVGDIGQTVSGLASFSPGEDVVVFLRKKGPRFAVNGLGQGKYAVRPGKDGKTPLAVPQDLGDAELLDPNTQQKVSSGRPTLALSELRRQVKAAAQAPAVTP